MQTGGNEAGARRKQAAGAEAAAVARRKQEPAAATGAAAAPAFGRDISPEAIAAREEALMKKHGVSRREDLVYIASIAAEVLPNGLTEMREE